MFTKQTLDFIEIDFSPMLQVSAVTWNLPASTQFRPFEELIEKINCTTKGDCFKKNKLECYLHKKKTFSTLTQLKE